MTRVWLAAAIVAACSGCAHDWDELLAETQSDGSTSSTGSGTTASCSGTDVCDQLYCFTGACTYACKDASDCTATCQGTSCTVSCEDQAQCLVNCVSGTCTYQCLTSDTANCTCNQLGGSCMEL